MNFENDFDGAKIIRLEQNYRSSGNILNAASSLISENKERIGKNFGPRIPLVKSVDIVNLENDEMEAVFVADQIKKLIRKRN